MISRTVKQESYPLPVWWCRYKHGLPKFCKHVMMRTVWICNCNFTLQCDGSWTWWQTSPEGTKLSLIKGKTSIRRFFFPPVWPIRTRHGPYNSVSGENHLEKGLVWSKAAGKSSQHKKQKQTKKRNQQRPANPPARFAFRQKTKQRSNKERGRAQTKTNKSTWDLPWTQWPKSLYHHQKHAN